MLINPVPLAALRPSGIFDPDWRQVYRTALFEKDRGKAAGLILDAERGASEKRQALDSALDALHLLRPYSRSACVGVPLGPT
jgi:hypothetical protein